MPVKHHEVDDNVHALLQSVVPDLPKSVAVGTYLFQDAVGDHLAYGKALPVFSIGLDSIRDGRLLDDLTLSGWRFMLFDQDQAVAYIDLDATGTEIANITRGRYVALTLDGLAAAEKLEETSNDDFYVSYIEIRNIYFNALWLHSEDAEDLIIPLDEQIPGEVSAMSAYSEAKIVSLLQVKRPFQMVATP